MLKTTGLFEKSALKVSKINSNKVVRGVGDRTDKTVKNLPLSKTRVPNIRATEKPELLTPSAKKAFNQLKLVFTKTLVLQHFNLECHIQIKPNALGYAIGGVFS